jgi:hypothetical protein
VSSATPRSAVNAEQLPLPGEGGGTKWLSPRQRALGRLYTKFRCTQYDGRSTDWDGTPACSPEEHDGISRTGVLPPGFQMIEGNMMPLRFRRPCAPVHLGRSIPMKLTSMLFGADKHPKLVSDDPLTEDWLTGFAEVTRLWSKLKQARNLGGSMGGVGLGFKFIKGKPLVEVHDPRWCTPEFEDRSELRVGSFEKRYQYSEQVRTVDGYETMWFWYRRLIDKTHDIIWSKVAVIEGEEPDWEQERFQAVEHGYDECPIVWIQNTELEEEIDGDPDCHAVFDLIESVDMLNSQARRGTLANCDPTLSITSDAEWGGIKKGSENAVQVEKGGNLAYLEMTGSGITMACSLRDEILEQICTVARVTLDRNEGGPSRTVAEIEHVYSSMLENCDELREQYGELGVKRLLEMVLRAARKLQGVRVDRKDPELPKIVRSSIKLPKKRIKDEKSGKITWKDRQLGDGEQIELRWPKYYKPSQEMIAASVNSAGTAKTFGILDLKHAVEHIAEDFQIENVNEVLAAIASEQEAAGGAGPEGGGDPDVAATVAERTLGGAKNPLPNPGAKQLAAVARQAGR